MCLDDHLWSDLIISDNDHHHSHFLSHMWGMVKWGIINDQSTEREALLEKSGIYWDRVSCPTSETLVIKEDVWRMVLFGTTKHNCKKGDR